MAIATFWRTFHHAMEKIAQPEAEFMYSTISLRFLGIILRVRGLEVSVYNVYFTTLQTPVPHFCSIGGGEGCKKYSASVQCTPSQYFADQTTAGEVTTLKKLPPDPSLANIGRNNCLHAPFHFHSLLSLVIIDKIWDTFWDSSCFTELMQKATTSIHGKSTRILKIFHIR